MNCPRFPRVADVSTTDGVLVEPQVIHDSTDNKLDRGMMVRTRNHAP